MPKMSQRCLAFAKWLLNGVLCLALGAVGPCDASGGGLPAQQGSVAGLRSVSPDQRIAASQALIEGWESAIPELVKELRQIDAGGLSFLSSDADSEYFRTLTDVLRAILSSKGVEAIKAFRRVDDPGAIRPLIWAARGSDRGLRLNSTVVLASVVDNSTVCLVLDHLRDDTLGADGRVNLLQVAIAVAGYMYKENVEAVRETADKLNKRLGAGDDTARSRNLIVRLREGSDSSSNKDQTLPLPWAKFCKTFRYRD